MTWGRKNGDAGNCPFFPFICTYNSMDRLLRARYTIMAQMNKAVLSLVGAAWHRMRDLHPATELYQADESHRSEAGSYLAACTFYTILFKKNPAAITYDYALGAADAANIRQVVKAQVWDSLSKWYQYRTVPAKPITGFMQMRSDRTVQFSNSSLYANSCFWTFGDGSSDTAASPKHIYAADATYTLRLIVTNCDGVRDTVTRQMKIGATSISSSESSAGLSIYPNPAKDRISIVCAELPISIALYDAQGRICRSILQPFGREVSLELNGLPAGANLLRLVYRDGSSLARVTGVDN